MMNYKRATQLLVFTLRFTRPAKLHFFHHPALYAAIMDRLNNPDKFPRGVWLYCPERGRIHYKAGIRTTSAWRLPQARS